MCAEKTNSDDWGALDPYKPDKSDPTLADVGINPDEGRDNGPKHSAEIATEFGQDDRDTLEGPDTGDQEKLLVDVDDENQRTLDGEAAANQSRY